MSSPRPWVLVACALGLFLIWSNSFLAIAYLLGSDRAPPRFDWVSLTVARFVPAALLCAAFCFGWNPRATLRILREEWARLIVCGLLVVPGYNLALYYGQQHGVAAPIASLTTTLVPLFVMVLAAAFLGEPLTRRRLAGFAVAALGMAIVSLAKPGGLGGGYPRLVAITALAPLSWSLYSIVSKPLAGRVSPILWTYLSTVVGTTFLLPWLPGSTWQRLVDLDATGWLAVLYLSVPCTVLGFAVWTWLLRHLQASVVGFSVFLNPPLTTTSKYVLAALLPGTFVFAVQPGEWIGGLVTLVGLLIAVYRRPLARTIHEGSS